MLGVGLEIPNFRAETPLLMSLATILTLTLVSLLYADTQRLGLTHSWILFLQCINLCLAYHLSSSTFLEISHLFLHTFEA